jgi:hypothetical protein
MVFRIFARASALAEELRRAEYVPVRTRAVWTSAVPLPVIVTLVHWEKSPVSKPSKKRDCAAALLGGDSSRKMAAAARRIADRVRQSDRPVHFGDDEAKRAILVTTLRGKTRLIYDI